MVNVCMRGMKLFTRFAVAILVAITITLISSKSINFVVFHRTLCFFLMREIARFFFFWAILTVVVHIFFEVFALVHSLLLIFAFSHRLLLVIRITILLFTAVHCFVLNIVAILAFFEICH